MEACPCNSGREYQNCCGPLIAGEKNAESAEALMRSRYTAYIKGTIEYLGATLHPDYRSDYDEASTRRWAKNAQWGGLEVVSAADGTAADTEGQVEFIASYKEKGMVRRHHEVAQFRKHDNVWYYTEGEMVAPETLRHTGPKIGRNDPCPCGSGRKYKKCCGNR